MTAEEIRKLIEIGDPVSYQGHILDQDLLKEMLAFSEKEERKYVRPKSKMGLYEHAMRESATERRYKSMTDKLMREMLEKFKLEQEKELLFGTKGEASPWTLEEDTFKIPIPRIQHLGQGIQVDLADVPYDMEPEDYVEKVAKKIEETGMIRGPIGVPGVPGAGRKTVYLDPSGNVSERPLYYVAVDPYDKIKELDLDMEKKAIDLFRTFVSTGIAVIQTLID